MGDEVKDDEVESDEAKEKEREESKSRGRKTQSLCSPSFLNALTQPMHSGRKKEDIFMRIMPQHVKAGAQSARPNASLMARVMNTHRPRTAGAEKGEMGR
jgi:hypothetical protein